MRWNIPLQTAVAARASQAKTSSLKPSHHPQKQQCLACGDGQRSNHDNSVLCLSRQRFVVNNIDNPSNKSGLTPQGGSLVGWDTGVGEQTCARCVCTTTCLRRNFQVEITFWKKGGQSKEETKQTKNVILKSWKYQKYYQKSGKIL